MAYLNSMWAVVGAMAFAGAVAPAHADTPVVTISSSVAQELPSANAACEGIPRDEARRLARAAQRDGAHHRAAACFRIAGDHTRADRAMIRAAADTSAVAGQKAAANLETAKMQARRLREAFR